MLVVVIESPYQRYPLVVVVVVDVDIVSGSSMKRLREPGFCYPAREAKRGVARQFWLVGQLSWL